MKVTMINGSPNPKGNSARILEHLKGMFEAEGIDVSIVNVPADTLGCKACYKCVKLGKCIIEDGVNEAAELLKASDGILITSPVYYAGISGSDKSFLDRLFFSKQVDFTGKVGGVMVTVRRGGSISALDQLYHYLTYSGMAVAGSTYWPMVYGAAPGESLKDEEGMQTAENMVRNMIFLMKSIQLGKELYGLPALTKEHKMNFIR